MLFFFSILVLVAPFVVKMVFTYCVGGVPNQYLISLYALSLHRHLGLDSFSFVVILEIKW